MKLPYGSHPDDSKEDSISTLHAPALDGQPLDVGEQQVFDQQTDEDHRRQPCKDFVGVQLVTILEDVPAQTTLAGRCAEDQFGGDQVRRAKAQPIFRPARIDGSAAGIKMCQTKRKPLRP